VLECSWVRRALGARRHCFFLAVLPPPLPGRRQRGAGGLLPAAQEGERLLRNEEEALLPSTLHAASNPSNA
jgi:hypothetical protein